VIGWAWQHPLEYYTVITADYNKKVPERTGNGNGGGGSFWNRNRNNRGARKKKSGNNSQAHRVSERQPMHTHADFAGHEGVSCSHQHGADFLKDDRQHSAQTPTWRISLKFWLMTPSIVFEELSAQAHSVVLASGTLAPTTSFRTELGADFASRITNASSYEGFHVIKAKEQLFASILMRSPNGWTIDGSYKARAELREQAKETNSGGGRGGGGGGARRPPAPKSYVMHVGDCVYFALAKIPADGGVLVFVPSYKILGEMEKEWESSGLIDGIRQRRNGAEVVFEPRGGGQEAFEEAKEEFMGAVNAGRGPVLVAVFRGKMSEGISFNDNYCRAVFCVGIPYPSVGDLNIKLKKRYNDMRNKVEDGYISGNTWYGLQAFRGTCTASSFWRRFFFYFQKKNQ
jgi:Rad3-related DNA helicase